MSKSTETPTQGTCRMCGRPWRDIVSSKCEHGVFKDSEGIEYTYHTVGSGITQYQCVTFRTQDDWLKKRQSPAFYDPFTADLLNDKLADIEKDALQVLDRAGLLTPKEDYQLPGKQGIWRGLLYRLRENGYQEAIDEEWFAASILTHSAGLRDFVYDERFTKGKNFKKKSFRNTVLYAMIFGMMVAKWDIRFGYVKNQSKSGGITRGKRQTANRVSEWEKWQAAANEIWKKHPTWGKPSVAGIVQKQFPKATVRTIRLRINKPTQ